MIERPAWHRVIEGPACGQHGIAGPPCQGLCRRWRTKRHICGCGGRSSRTRFPMSCATTFRTFLRLCARRRPCRSGHSAYEPSLPGRSIEGEGGSKIAAVRGFRSCSPERTVSTLAITPLLRRRSSGRVSGRCGLCRHLRRRSAGDPNAGSPLKHQLRRHLSALRLRGVSRRCGACEGVGRATSVPWPGAHSSCRDTTQAEPGRGAAVRVLCRPDRLPRAACVSEAVRPESKRLQSSFASTRSFLSAAQMWCRGETFSRGH
jgi:hypothetical protein